MQGLFNIVVFLGLIYLFLKGDELMSYFDDQKAFNAAIKASVAKVAADVAALTAKVGTGMTEAQVADLKAEGQSIVDALAALDAQTPDEPPTT